MTNLFELAAVVRSKNAGPLWLTLDIMFDDEASYRRALHADRINAETIAALYGVKPDTVSVIPYPIVRAIKVTLPRRQVSGALDETDVYGCQQHVPLFSIRI